MTNKLFVKTVVQIVRHMMSLLRNFFVKMGFYSVAFHQLFSAEVTLFKKQLQPAHACADILLLKIEPALRSKDQE